MIRNFRREPKVQGEDTIHIHASVATVWPLIRDSAKMESWGPPVEKVEVELLADQVEEGVGSIRKVYAHFNAKRKGWYKEIRVDQVHEQSVTFLIYEDSFGMGRLLEDVGAKMELEKRNDNTCLFTFTFYHRPKNILGWIMNPMIKIDQKKNRLKALLSIKQYVETGTAIKNNLLH